MARATLNQPDNRRKRPGSERAVLRIDTQNDAGTREFHALSKAQKRRHQRDISFLASQERYVRSDMSCA